MGLLEYVYLSFIINYFELQESIDFIRDLSWLGRNYGRATPVIHWFAIAHTSPTNSPLGLFA